ncbi:MAG: amidohydrolase family protein [Thiohalocapsa sp.]
MSTPYGQDLFDAHLHVVDPRFELQTNQSYLPQPFTVDDYLATAEPLGIVGGAVVSGSFQGFDQAYLRAALIRLGPGFVGVTQLPVSADAAMIAPLDTVGVRALRFNLRRGVQQDWVGIDRLARLAFETARWHAEFYLGATALVALETRLAALPAIAIDHLGLERAALPALLRLAEQGARIKASGFGRLDFDPAAAIAAIASANPRALMFGTDLPSTRAPRPFSLSDLDVLCVALDDEALIRAALRDNARALYRLTSPPESSVN